MSDQIVSASEDGINTIRFNRPEKKNALTRAMYEAMVAQLEAAGRDPKVRVILFCGAGGAFTAGNDLSDFMNDPPKGDASPVFRFLMALLNCEKPVVAAVEGVAVGLGTTMLLHCDLVYAADSAKFTLPFVNLGLVPEFASSHLLPRMLGNAKAGELLLFGETFGPDVALRAGIVNEVLPAAELMPRAMARARALADRPIGALMATKRLLRASQRGPIEEAMKREGAAFVDRLASAEAAEAFSAFFEKRKPDFRKLS